MKEKEVELANAVINHRYHFEEEAQRLDTEHTSHDFTPSEQNRVILQHDMNTLNVLRGQTKMEMDVVAKVICRMYSSAIPLCISRYHSLQQRSMVLLLCVTVLTFLASSASAVGAGGDMVLTINDDFQPLTLDDFQPLPPFWTSTGLCPPEPRNETAAFLLSKAMQLNLQLIGSLTERAISYVRIHWLLELIQV